GTHDNNTARGWFESEATPLAREQLSALVGGAVTGGDVSYKMVELALSSRARFALYPMQDLLGLGAEARLNTPGKPRGNWLWRVREEQLLNAPAGELTAISARHGRISPGRQNSPGVR
ncbi:MAG: 4-alpha-glucanotransferase, partial [Synergistaceae bacterium]|nr:4-alpha-glucanotransferase [Synergistaceae bacterium]